jgi:hypothetical protein
MMTQLEVAWDENVEALAAAMLRVLDDMGGGPFSSSSSTSVCLATKAQARIAYEPFAGTDERAIIMPIEEARRILAEVS